MSMRTLMQSASRAPRRPSGFTLVEVLLATIIIALGVLGLAAVFAGALSQQQRATQQTLSVGVTRNAEALLSRKIGNLAGEALDQASGTIAQNVWYALPIRNETDPALTVDPLGDGSLFFSVPSGEAPVREELYTNDFVGAGGQTEVPGTLGVGSFSFGSGGGLGGPDGVQRFSNERVNPSTLTIEINTKFSPLSGIDEGNTYTYVLDTTGSQQDIEFDTPDAEIPGRLRYVENDNSSLTLEFSMGGPIVAGPGGDTRAGIISFNIPLDPNEIISSVEASYRWRNDRLISLNDRLVYVDDPSFPRGRRPILGYTGLYRSLGNSSQLAIVTYSLRPQSRPQLAPAEFPFVPPQTISALNTGNNDPTEPRGGMLRVVSDINLGCEGCDDPSEDNRYFIEIDRQDIEELGWLMEPGQILMMRGDDQASPVEPGSDDPVRVVIVEEAVRDPDGGGEPENVLRGFLDRSPRANGRSPLRSTSPDAREPIDLFAMYDTVQSLSGNGALWSVEPVEVRIIQIQ